MASKEYPLSIIIKTVDKATAGLRSIGKTMDGVAKRAEKISKAMRKVGKKMTSHVTAPIVGIGVASVKAFGKFEDGMATVATVIDTTVEDIGAMGKEVLRLAKDLAVPVEGLTSSLFMLRSGGVAAADQFAVLNKTAQLSIAGLGTMEETTQLVLSVINTWGLTGAEAEAVYNQLFKTTANGITTIAQLSQGFGDNASAAQAAGVSHTEYLAAVAALTTTGTKASVIHTKLAAVLSGLGGSGKQTQKVLKKLGAKTMQELIARSGGLVPALQEVFNALDGNRTKMQEVVGGASAMGAVTGLLGAQNEAFTKTLTDMMSKEEKLASAFHKRNTTTVAGYQKMKNALTAAGVAMGKHLIPVIKVLTEKIVALADWFTSLDDNTREWYIAIAKTAAIMGPVILVLGSLSSAIVGIATAIRVVSLAIAANPIAALAMVIAMAAVSIYSNWEDFEDFFKLLWDGVTDIFEAASDVILSIIEEIMDGVDAVITGAQDLHAFVTGGETSTDRFRAETDESAVRELGITVNKGVHEKKETERKKQEMDEKFAALEARLAAEAATAGTVAGGLQGGAAEVKVSFENMPAGARVETTKSSGLDVSTETGYQMGGS